MTAQGPLAQGNLDSGPRQKRRAYGDRKPLGKDSFFLSLGVHVGVLSVLLFGFPAFAKDETHYETYEIRIVSPPPASAERVEEERLPVPEEELVVETPQELVLEVEEEIPVPAEEAELPAEEAEPEPEPREPSPVVEPEETPSPAAEPAVPANAEEVDEADPGEDMNARMEGLRRDFPRYYGNIIRQMRRCFRPVDAGSREVKVTFVILKDGSTSKIGVAQSSGSFAFDLEAMGAAECVGRAGRLGPLPADYAWDVLPIQFTLTTKRR